MTTQERALTAHLARVQEAREKFENLWKMIEPIYNNLPTEVRIKAQRDEWDRFRDKELSNPRLTTEQQELESANK